METLVHRARRLRPGMAAMAMAVLYLAITTQLALPLGEYIEAAVKTETEVRKESISGAGSSVPKAAFACALHKCGCRNAEQCRTSCCCFPKGSRTHSTDAAHDHGGDPGEDHMTRYQACNGPDGPDHGSPPLFSAHLLPRPAPLPDPLPFRGPFPAGMDKLSSPFPEAPQKIPI